ncbi:MAG TPA: sulfur transferase domain-containing protein [Blastocatellia bacterium]|nr:sulfur transferase domain-containing protein [Blastocatellia bacterium]
MRVTRARSSAHIGHGSRILSAVVVWMLIAAAGLAQGGLRYAELPNFHRVNERLYRGGQPKAGGIKKLAEIGIKTIINLRGEDSQTGAGEEAAAKAAGVSYFNIPMPGLSRPTNEQISRVMTVINTRENWPVFVHCKRGSDRTGTVVAIYRISQDEWTADQALTEAKRLGLNWIEFGMKDYVSDYYRDRSVRKQKESESVAQQPLKRGNQ